MPISVRLAYKIYGTGKIGKRKSLGDCNGTGTHNILARKQTFNHLWPVWLNVWVFVYELSVCGFEFWCRHLNFDIVLIFADICFFKVTNGNNNMWNLFKVNNKDNRTRSWSRSGVFIVDFEHVSRIVQVFSLLTLNT